MKNPVKGLDWGQPLVENLMEEQKAIAVYTKDRAEYLAVMDECTRRGIGDAVQRAEVRCCTSYKYIRVTPWNVDENSPIGCATQETYEPHCKIITAAEFLGQTTQLKLEDVETPEQARQFIGRKVRVSDTGWAYPCDEGEIVGWEPSKREIPWLVHAKEFTDREYGHHGVGVQCIVGGPAGDNMHTWAGVREIKLLDDIKKPISPIIQPDKDHCPVAKADKDHCAECRADLRCEMHSPTCPNKTHLTQLSQTIPKLVVLPEVNKASLRAFWREYSKSLCC